MREPVFHNLELAQAKMRHERRERRVSFSSYFFLSSRSGVAKAVNVMYSVARAVIDDIIACVPVCLVARCGSALRRHPLLSQTLQTFPHEIRIFDTCRFGTAWRTRVRVVFWGFSVSGGRQEMLCKGKRSCCGDTGRPHQPPPIIRSDHRQRTLPRFPQQTLAKVIAGRINLERWPVPEKKR